MANPMPEAVARLCRRAAPEPDDVLDEMETTARESGFPTIGPDAGAFYRLSARLTAASSVFEFGSGFGYSAYWVAPALPSDGQIVLTEHDPDELDMAREFFARGGYDDRAVFEEGDAIETVERYDGPFDLVLVDNEDDRYVEAFEAVRGKVAPGGIVLADNVLAAGEQFGPDAVLDALDGDEAPATAHHIADYYERVRADPDFETALVPVGEGLLASVRL
ncbi:O-methyltransferase [Halococcus hamelinensis]|uniref:O-methyltransferase family protein n=1 Tax=Halococcus hamelinensis 100A6 TaxID=1132509 RepID=M0LSZ4_9EURY|nr:O-methyltransferase [Halococcus hamelinensis]EMA35499.1 O-methyltransferase family protein [Halococcus hamelinensis 100A6]